MKKITSLLLIFTLIISSLFCMSVSAYENEAISLDESYRVIIKGNIGSDKLGTNHKYFDRKEVTLTLKNTSTGDVDYIQQTTIDNEGNYKFDFYCDNLTYSTTQVTSHTVSLNLAGQNVTDTITSSKIVSKFVTLTLLPSYDSFNDKVKLNALIENSFGLEVDYTLYVVFYGDENRLLDVDKVPRKTTGDVNESILDTEAISIPDGTKLIKFMAWNNEETLIPYTTAREVEPDNFDDKIICIFKLDDLGYGNYKKFDKAYNYFKSYGITQIGFGAVGHSWYDYKDQSDYDSAFLTTVRKWVNDGVEIWCHGNLHKRNESDTTTGDQEGYEYFSADSYATQLYNLQTAVDTINNDIGNGYKVRTFGAPYNACSKTTAKVLAENYDTLGIETVMLGETLTKDAFHDDEGNPTTFPVNLGNDARIESSTGVMNYDNFVKKFNSNVNAGNKVLVMQGHGAQWDDADYAELDKIVHFLLSNPDVTFMTPSQYYDYSHPATK
ncbi:MAG: DUF2334 domain-containing protein [Ruminococcaceae bacterium]|nr:DUF2334 domain-containing protein [Oscillospiraceae bacterium]